MHVIIQHSKINKSLGFISDKAELDFTSDFFLSRIILTPEL